MLLTPTPDPQQAAATLAARAATPEERLSPAFDRRSDTAAAALAAARRDRWIETAARRDGAAFDRMLAWRGIDPQIALAALAPVTLAPGAPLPDWIDRLQALVADHAAAVRDAAGLLPAARGVPHADVVAPLALVVLRRIGNGLPFGPARGVATAFMRWAGHILAAALQETVSARAGLSALVPGVRQPPSPALRAADFDSFLQARPVLARLLVTLVDNWVGATAEMLARLATDRAAIGETFLGGADPGHLTAVEADLSDPHDGGRVVMALTFDSGLRLVYKPRPVDCEAAWARVVHWLNARDTDGPGLLAAPVLACGDHGWMGWIEHARCRTAAERALYLRRFGMTLALAHLLRVNDLHFENLVAAGPHPVLVDLETIFHPAFREARTRVDPDRVEVVALRWVEACIGRTGLLPGAGAAAEDRSALTGAGDPAVPARHLPVAPEALEPLLREHWPLLVGGITHLFRVVLRHRAGLLAADGPLDGLETLRTRIVFRDTETYAAILKRSLRPACLGDAADRRVALEVLARMMLVQDVRPLYTPLLEQEIAALTALDLPRFTVMAGTADPMMRDAGLSAARDTIAALNEAEAARQADALRGLLAARLATVAAPPAAPALLAVAEAPPPAADPGRCLEAARTIGAALERAAFRGPNGDATWLTLQPTGVGGGSSSGRRTLAQAPHTLDTGLLAPMLVGAALARVTGEARWSVLTDAATATVGRLIGETELPPGARLMPGLMHGLGAKLRALTLSAALLDRPAVAEAGVLVAQMQPDPDDACLATGTAGGALALCAAGAESAVLAPFSVALLAAPEPSTPGLLTGAGGLLLAHRRLAAHLDSPAHAAAATALAEAISVPPALTGWAEGLVGVAQAAQGLAAAEALVARALNAARRPQPDAVDTLRDGTAGRIALLLAAGEDDAAARLAAAMLDRAKAEGGFRLLPGVPPGLVDDPGLLDGLSGIAWTLLRLADPAAVPDLIPGVPA